MLKLFSYEGYEVVVAPEALMLEAFKVLWDRDSSPDKRVARLEFAYIYFFADPRSDYAYITDEGKRSQEIKMGLGLEDWSADKKIRAAIRLYRSFMPISLGLLEDARCAIDKLRIFLREVDLMATDERGKPLYSVSTISSTIKQIPELVNVLKEAEKAVTSDITESEMRGGMDKTIAEDDYV